MLEPTRPVVHVHRRLPAELRTHPYRPVETDPMNHHIEYGSAITGMPYSGAIVYDLPVTDDERAWVTEYLPCWLIPGGWTAYLRDLPRNTAPEPPTSNPAKARRTGKLLMAAGAILIVLSALLLLTACGWHGTGTVTQRDYSPGYMFTSTHMVGKIMVPSTSYMPPHWTLTVRDTDGHTHRVSVSEHDYDADPIGSTFTNGQ